MDIQMYAVKWCPDCRAVRRFLDAREILYTLIDIDVHPEASEEVIRRVGKRAIPQLVIDGEWFQPYVPGEGLLKEEICRRLGIPVT